MKLFKKLLIVGMSVAMIGSIAACGNNSPSAAVDDNEPTIEETVEKNAKAKSDDDFTERDFHKDVLDNASDALRESDKDKAKMEWEREQEHRKSDEEKIKDSHYNLDEHIKDTGEKVGEFTETVLDGVKDTLNDGSKKPDVPRKIGEVRPVYPDYYPTSRKPR